MNLLPPVGENIESLDVDTPDAVTSGKETVGGSSKVGSDICVVPDGLQTAVSVTTVVSEKWMERFVLDLDDLHSDVLASGEDPAGGSSDVRGDICVIPDPLPTAVSVRTVVAEEWMGWFVLDLVESPSVSRTSAVARTFGPTVSEEYSPVVLAGGGEVADAYPLVVVVSDTARVSDLPMVESDTARVSVLPVDGCKFPAVFLGKVALDVVGLGVGTPCLRVDSEETLLTLMNERAQLVRAAPGVTPEDGSEEGAPVLELIEHSVMGKSLVDSLQEPMPAMKRLKLAILATVSVWEPLEHLHCVVSNEVDFDSFWIAPWDAGGMLGDSCLLCVIFWRTLLRSRIRLSGRPAIVADMIMKIKTESPRLTVTPGAWYASDLLATTSTGFRQMDDIPKVMDAVKLDYRTVRGFPQIASTQSYCDSDTLLLLLQNLLCSGHGVRRIDQ